MYEVSLLGVGNMGEALLRGWLRSNLLNPSEVVVADRDQRKLSTVARKYGIEASAGVREAVSLSRTVVLAVKPQDSGQLLIDISEETGVGRVVISVIAGLTLETMRGRLGPGPSIVRVMPNMAAGVGAAVSAYAVEPGPGEFDRVEVRALLESVGEALEVKEEQIDLVTALSGSGPAYFFYMVEALEKAGLQGGLSPEKAELLARETLWGAAKVLRETGRTASEHREAVSSPGGTTLAALEEMKKARFEQIVISAVEAARKRAGELSG